MPVPGTDTGHAWHSLIDEKERQRFVAQLELFHELESRTRVGAHHAKSFPQLPTQVPLNGAENIYVVVNCQNHRFLHSFSNYNRSLARPTAHVDAEIAPGLEDQSRLEFLSVRHPAFTISREKIISSKIAVPCAAWTASEDGFAQVGCA